MILVAMSSGAGVRAQVKNLVPFISTIKSKTKSYITVDKVGMESS